MPHPTATEDEDVEIISATPDVWQAACEIRLESLLRDPHAFGSTYAEAVDRTEADWRAWLSRPGLTMLIARTSQSPVGIVGALRGVDADDDSVAMIVSMYVTASLRGRGVGRQLLQVLLADLEEDSTLTRVILHVSRGQLPAQRLYTALGFVPVSEEDDEIVMERPLR
jgi:GNAT superfamily N-acetyltransferase